MLSLTPHDDNGLCIGNGVIRGTLEEFRHNLRRRGVSLKSQLLLLLFLLLLFLLFSLQEVVGCLPSGDQIDMQEDEVDKKKGKYRQHCSDQPREYTHNEVSPLLQPGTNCGYNNMCNHSEGICESGDDAHEEVPIISLAHAVIKPHTVMIKQIDAPITGAAVLAIRPAVTITVLAKQYFIVLRSKGYLLIEFRPFVVVHHPVSGVNQRSSCRAHYHCSPEDSIEDDQHQLMLEGLYGGEVDGYGGCNHQVGCYLCC